MISYGADITLTNNQGVGVLHIASQGDQAPMIYYLVKQEECEIEQTDDDGNTPLHWAAISGSENSTTFLLALGADPNSQNKNGSTPLHLGTKSIEVHWSMRNLKMLLLEGARRSIRDEEGMTALEYSEEINSAALQNE